MTAAIIPAHTHNIESRKAGLTKWAVPNSVRQEVLRFLEDLELGKVNRGRRISIARQAKYLDLLRAPLEAFAKPTARLTPKDIETFERALSTDAIQSYLKNIPYAQATKADIRKLLKISVLS